MAQVALFDADRTLHEDFSIFPLYEVFAAEGLVASEDSSRLQEIFAQYNNGETEYHDFAMNTLNVAAWALRGREEATATRVADLFFSGSEFNWFGYVVPLLSEAENARVESILITAEPQFIAGGIVAALGMNRLFSSRFGVELDGRFDGSVSSVLGSKQKGEITQGLAAHSSRSFAFGDSEGDIGMLELVDEAICIKPTPELRSHAMEQGWTIIDDPHQPLEVISFSD